MKAASLVCVLLLAACGSTPPSGPSPVGPRGNPAAVLVGAGDIGECDSPAVAATGRMAQEIDGHVILAGDIAYPHGTRGNFIQCFEPFWGSMRDRWRPVPGNHEYETPGARDYFEYFGAAAGSPNLGFYRFLAGEWIVLMLNSNVSMGRGSMQYEFVRQNLADLPSRCAAAVFHHPLFSSGQNGGGTNPELRELWQLLYDSGVDLVINGHEHMYERFSRQTPQGQLDTARGIRQITVGTGGAALTRGVNPAPNSGLRLVTHGIIRVQLLPAAYDWQFLPVGGGVGDSGFTGCH